MTRRQRTPSVRRDRNVLLIGGPAQVRTASLGITRIPDHAAALARLPNLDSFDDVVYWPDRHAFSIPSPPEAVPDDEPDWDRAGVDELADFDAPILPDHPRRMMGVIRSCREALHRLLRFVHRGGTVWVIIDPAIYRRPSRLAMEAIGWFARHLIVRPAGSGHTGSRDRVNTRAAAYEIPAHVDHPAIERIGRLSDAVLEWPIAFDVQLDAGDDADSIVGTSRYRWADLRLGEPFDGAEHTAVSGLWDAVDLNVVAVPPLYTIGGETRAVGFLDHRGVLVVMPTPSSLPALLDAIAGPLRDRNPVLERERLAAMLRLVEPRVFPPCLRTPEHLLENLFGSETRDAFYRSFRRRREDGNDGSRVGESWERDVVLKAIRRLARQSTLQSFVNAVLERLESMPLR